jgi:hypothetical protein
MACGTAWAAADAQQTNNGHHYGWRNRDRGQYANQCGYAQYGHQHGRRHRDGNDNDGDNDADDNNNQYGQYGQQYGQQYGRYGQNGQNGRYNNCGQYGAQYGGNAVVSGQIVGVDRNMVTIQTGNGAYNQGGYGGYGYGRTITIDDQPALDNQTSGRVSVGRYVTAYGYWQNGTFYATRMN